MERRLERVGGERWKRGERERERPGEGEWEEEGPGVGGEMREREPPFGTGTIGNAPHRADSNLAPATCIGTCVHTLHDPLHAQIQHICYAMLLDVVVSTSKHITQYMSCDVLCCVVCVPFRSRCPSPPRFSTVDCQPGTTPCFPWLR